MDNKWSNRLREKMDSYKEVPPQDLWRDIEQAIQKSRITVLVRKNKTYWTKRYVAIAAVFLFCLSVGFILREEYLVSGRCDTAAVTSEYIDISDKTEQNIVDLLVSEDVIDSRIEEEYYEVKYPHLSNTEENQSQEDGEVTKEDTNKQNEKEVANQSNPGSIKEDEEPKKDETTSKPSLLPPKNDSFLKLNLYASNFGSDFNNQERNYPRVLASDNISSDAEIYPSDNPLMNSIAENNLYRDVVTRVKHKQPIRLGVSIGFNINNKWSLTSGLIYTKLSSDLFSGSDSYYYTGEQVLHYIGIPIAVRYNVLQYNQFSFYTSFGGMVEKNVSGRQTTRYTLDNSEESQKRESISIAPLQVSIKTSIGLQYNISKHIGIYAEPSLGYYFKNNNKIQTIYQKKRFNLDFNIGVNFRFSK